MSVMCILQSFVIVKLIHLHKTTSWWLHRPNALLHTDSCNAALLSTYHSTRSIHILHQVLSKHSMFLARGTDLERGYGDVRPWRPPFHASPAVRKGPISSKRISSQDPLLRKFGNFSLYNLNFRPNFSSQYKPPNLESFSSQAPFFRGKY